MATEKEMIDIQGEGRWATGAQVGSFSYGVEKESGGPSTLAWETVSKCTWEKGGHCPWRQVFVFEWYSIGIHVALEVKSHKDLEKKKKEEEKDINTSFFFFSLI